MGDPLGAAPDLFGDGPRAGAGAQSCRTEGAAQARFFAPYGVFSHRDTCARPGLSPEQPRPGSCKSDTAVLARRVHGRGRGHGDSHVGVHEARAAFSEGVRAPTGRPRGVAGRSPQTGRRDTLWCVGLTWGLF